MIAVTLLTIATVPSAAPMTGSGPGTDAGQGGRVAKTTCCSPDPGREPTPRARELMRARVDALRQIEAESRDRVAQGLFPEVEYHRASLRRLRAELELTTDRAKRIALREEVVERTRQQEELSAAAGFDRTARARHLERRVERLEAEIDLERERESCPTLRPSECRCRPGR